MATPEIAPRRPIGGMIAVWVVAAVLGVVIGIFVSPESRGQWLPIALGGCLLLSFGIQLGIGRPHGFIARVGASILGAAVVLGVISLGYGLAGVVPG